MKNSAVLLIDCPDARGLVAAIANFLLGHNANILHADQHQDGLLKLFFMRVEWDLQGFGLDFADFARQFEPIAQKFNMRWQLHSSRRPQKVAILVSRQDHCLADILYRHRSGELACDIRLVISNHGDAKPLAEFYGIPFVEIPVRADDKGPAEKKQVGLLASQEIDLIVLARYMQILSPAFVDRYREKIINVHHSFLPAFPGAHPYRRAFERGVKLIGATSHYVTQVLDDGPIIEQDIIRVSHRDSAEDLAIRGRDIERIVLSRAVRWHVEHRIVVYGNKTVVFD